MYFQSLDLFLWDLFIQLATGPTFPTVLWLLRLENWGKSYSFSCHCCPQTRWHADWTSHGRGIHTWQAIFSGRFFFKPTLLPFLFLLKESSFGEVFGKQKWKWLGVRLHHSILLATELRAQKERLSDKTKWYESSQGIMAVINGF